MIFSVMARVPCGAIQRDSAVVCMVGRWTPPRVCGISFGIQSNPSSRWLMASPKSAAAKNLELLLSPKKLTAALGSVLAQQYWSAWEACKLSAVREFALDPDLYDDQKAINEIAAGRSLVMSRQILLSLPYRAVPGARLKPPKRPRQLSPLALSPRRLTQPKSACKLKSALT